MDELKGYVVSGDNSVLPSDKQVERILRRYPWFTTVRAIRRWRTGEPDDVLDFSLTGKPLPKIFMRSFSGAPRKGSLGLIDSFLRMGERRILPGDNASEEDLAAGSVVMNIDEPTEELARVYMSQGLLREAREIYDKLILLKPKKSVYFAQIIADLDARIGAATGGSI